MMPRRYQLVAATFLLSMLLYVDRVCISAAKQPIAADLHFDDREMGWVFAAFSLGYALLQTPAGMAADRFGPRRVLACVVTLWSIFTALTAFAWNWVAMLVVRFLFGAGEAGAFPGMARAFLAWLPVQERGLAHGINFSASRLGAALALPVISWAIGRIGWQSTFVALGVVGVGWAVGWYLWFRDDPAADGRLTDAEREYILAHRQATAAGQPALTPGTLIWSRNLWLLMGQYFASNFTFFFALTWLLPHLQGKFELSPVAAGWLGALPLVGGMAGNWLSGFLVDRWHRRGLAVASRSRTAVIGFAFAALGMSLLAFAVTLPLTLLGLMLAVFGADMTLSPSWSFCTDIGGPHAGTVSGTMNMAGNIGAFVTSLAFPYLLAWTGSPVPFFLVAAGLNLAAVGCWFGVNGRGVA